MKQKGCIVMSPWSCEIDKCELKIDIDSCQNVT